MFMPMGESNFVLSDGDFSRLGQFINDYSGIRMPDSKKSMVEVRLRPRVRYLGYQDFNDYCDYLFNDGGLEDEWLHIIDAVTTNKTDFFREPDHFQYFVTSVVPLYLKRHRAMKVWSAGCSNGAEPYTLAMLLADVSRFHPRFDFHILGTDLSSEILDEAVRAIYPEEMIEPVPMDMRKRYLLRSRDPSVGRVRIAPELRSKVRFGRLNFMDDIYGVDKDFDAIFCRNVLIYFEKSVQSQVLARLCEHLAPDGHLFIGHSETVASFDLPLRQVGPTTFVKI